MKFPVQGVFFVAMVLAFSGCVTSHYKNDQGCDCTRRYFTILGIPTHSCSDVCQGGAEPVVAQGKELKVIPLAPSPSLRQSTPAKTIEQNIRTTTQAFHR